MCPSVDGVKDVRCFGGRSETPLLRDTPLTEANLPSRLPQKLRNPLPVCAGVCRFAEYVAVCISLSACVDKDWTSFFFYERCCVDERTSLCVECFEVFLFSLLILIRFF